MWKLLDVGSLTHGMTADGGLLLSTGPLSMTVDAEALAPVTASDLTDVAAAASSAAMAMNAGRHLNN